MPVSFIKRSLSLLSPASLGAGRGNNENRETCYGVRFCIKEKRRQDAYMYI